MQIESRNFTKQAWPSNGRVDYIIAGAGCAGLSLAMHMIATGKFADKRIVLIDQDPKRSNDRTWCFWQSQDGLFEPIVHRKWQQLWFHGTEFSTTLRIAPYSYKMIRGIDFYEYCLESIRKQPNFTILHQKLDGVFSTDKGAGVIMGKDRIHADYVFNSILFDKPRPGIKDYWLLQHFKGWVINTAQKAFDPGKATIMDFRTDQGKGTAFCYVLPFSDTEALIEYTLFSSQLLSDEEYDQGLQAYIKEVLGVNDYTVREQEKGCIPMTNFRFPGGEKGIVNIGTAGGQTKGSSGYTFNFIQKHSLALVQALLLNKNPIVPGAGRRFAFYDSVLLHILCNGTLRGQDIFTDLFKNNAPPKVLKFLDNETSVPEELRIISTLPALPFLKAAFKQMF